MLAGGPGIRNSWRAAADCWLLGSSSAPDLTGAEGQIKPWAHVSHHIGSKLIELIWGYGGFFPRILRASSALRFLGPGCRPRDDDRVLRYTTIDGRTENHIASI